MTLQVKKFPPLVQVNEAIQKSPLLDSEKLIASAYAGILAEKPVPIDYYNACWARMAVLGSGENGWSISPDKRFGSLSRIAKLFSSLSEDPVVSAPSAPPLFSPNSDRLRRVPSGLLLQPSGS